MISREETEKEIEKTKKWRLFFMIFCIGLFIAGVVLIIIFAFGNDIPTLLMGIVALVWSAVLLNQFLKSREILEMMTERLNRAEGVDTGKNGGRKEDPDPGESGPVEP